MPKVSHYNSNLPLERCAPEIHEMFVYKHIEKTEHVKK